MTFMEVMDFIFGEDGLKSLRIQILDMFLKNCNPEYPVYVGDIPSLYLRNAGDSYAPYELYVNILAIADDTVFGTFKRGLLFTNEGVYYKGLLQTPEYSEYGTLEVFDDMYSSSYNIAEVDRLFKWLNNLELLSNVYSGIKTAIEILDLSEEEMEDIIDQYFEEIIVPAMEESARLLDQEIASGFIQYIMKIIKNISDVLCDF